MILKCPYCGTPAEKPDSLTWLVIYEKVANAFQGYTKQCQEEVTATACRNPACGKGFMIKC